MSYYDNFWANTQGERNSLFAEVKTCLTQAKLIYAPSRDFTQIQARADKQKGEDIFNDVTVMHEPLLEFKGQYSLTQLTHLNTLWETLKEQQQTFKHRRDQDFMTVTSKDVKDNGGDYLKDYNVMRFGMVVDALQNLQTLKSKIDDIKLIENYISILNNNAIDEKDIMSNCMDVYVLDVFIKQSRMRHKDEIHGMIKCIESMNNTAIEIGKEIINVIKSTK